MNRKQKAMEEVHRTKSASPRNRDLRPIAKPEDVARMVKMFREWGDNNEETRQYVCSNYKNGAELFDRLIEIENSPLMKALA